MIAALRTRNISLLLAGRLVSGSGDWLYSVAMSVAVYRFSGHDSAAVGILLLVRMLPFVVLGRYSGALASRLGYRHAMIAADLGRMVLVALLVLVLHPTTWIALYPLVLLIAALGTLFRPASAGIIPSLVESKDQLLATNATVMQADNIALLVGSLLGGIGAGLGGTTPLLLAQALTFGASAGSLAFLRPHPPAQLDEVGEANHAPSPPAGGGWVASIRFILDRPILRFLVLIVVLPELVSGATIVWLVPYSSGALHLGNAGVGYLYAALGAGSILGGFATTRLGSERPLDAALAASVAVGGLALVLFGLVPVAAVALVAVGVLGAAETVELTIMDTLVQTGVSERLIGQAMGTIMSICMAFMLAGNVLSGVLVRVLGLRPSMIGLGVLVAAVSPLVWFAYRRQVAQRPSDEVLLTVPAFAMLPPELRRWAVQRMVRSEFSPGTVLMRRGEWGDTLYAIVSGTVEIDDAGRARSELGPGHVIGEIALLHDGWRSATVTARTPVVAYALARAEVDELQSRAGEFRDSLHALATARLGAGGAARLALAARA